LLLAVRPISGARWTRYVAFDLAFLTRTLMSAAKYPSGIDFGVTLTPPSPAPATATIDAWYVPAGLSNVVSRGEVESLHATAGMDATGLRARLAYRSLTGADD